MKLELWVTHCERHADPVIAVAIRLVDAKRDACWHLQWCDSDDFRRLSPDEIEWTQPGRGAVYEGRVRRNQQRVAPRIHRVEAVFHA